MSRVTWKLAGLTFRVEPLGPISRCLRFTKRSLFLTRVPILMMSQATSSCNIRTAWKRKTPNQKSASLNRNPSCNLTAASWLPVQTAHSWQATWWGLWLSWWRRGRRFSSWCKRSCCPRSDPERPWRSERKIIHFIQEGNHILSLFSFSSKQRQCYQF